MIFASILLNFLYFKSPIGIIRVEYTSEGIVSLQFVEHQAADFTASPMLGHRILADLNGYFYNPNHTWISPIAAEIGTAFQAKVWSAVSSIPAGHIATYREIAMQIGQAKAAQAVGGANGQNPILLRIPCHRVIGSDGSMVGYAGELWRKEWLLRHEGYEGQNQQTSLFTAVD